MKKPIIIISQTSNDLWDLIVKDQNKQTLESLKKIIEDMFIRCEECWGSVVRSGDKYLCLSGCGHVEGEVREKTDKKNGENNRVK